MLLSNSAALAYSVSTGRSLMASENISGEMGVLEEDIVSQGRRLSVWEGSADGDDDRGLVDDVAVEVVPVVLLSMAVLAAGMSSSHGGRGRGMGGSLCCSDES